MVSEPGLEERELGACERGVRCDPIESILGLGAGQPLQEQLVETGQSVGPALQLVLARPVGSRAQRAAPLDSPTAASSSPRPLCQDTDKVTHLGISAFDVEQGLIALPGTPAGWISGDLVVWGDARPSLRGDTYVLGDHGYEAVELYCVEPDCGCGELIVDFSPVVPRGAPHPGHVEFDGTEATLHPGHDRHRTRLTELWTTYCRRHADHRERFARRSATMHGLAGRIVAAPPKPKVGRNAPCPCGSGRKFKQCCGAA
jgi:hypothetical protein